MSSAAAARAAAAGRAGGGRATAPTRARREQSSTNDARTSIIPHAGARPVRLSKTKKRAKEEEAAVRRESKGDGALRGRVEDAGHEARRWLGQHFLIDNTVVLDAIEAARLKPGDRILEIGPGTGNLTAEMAARGALVTAVEKDRNLVDTLREGLCKEYPNNLEVIEGDFLKWDGLEDAFKRSNAEMPRAKVVANIPYNITTDVLKVLLPMGDTFEDMIFMFQEEVAQRLVKDDAGGGDYRAMSVRVHYYSKPYYIRPVLRDCFMPPPNVESCLIGFKPKEPHELLPLSGTEKQFFTFVQGCFAQKRKMLRNNLKALCDDETLEQAFTVISREPKIRPQELTMEDYVKLFNFVRSRDGNSA